MRYYTRKLEPVLTERLGQFPVVALTGPRQSGKTTMVRHVLPDFGYVSLEDLDQRAAATSDPRGFLARWGPGTIIDEFQRAPRLVSYLQGVVDGVGRNGLYVLTGSQSYVLHEQLSQSLAGRVGLLVLHPFSFDELPAVGSAATHWEVLHAGGFPRTAANGVPPDVWYPSYVTTHVERDVRQILAVRDLLQFQLFMKLLASRTGQLVNNTALGRDCGLSVPTVRHWLSVLEAGHLIRRLPPWHSNDRKKLVRTPKVYFVDTGLLCHLLGISGPEELARHAARGAVFENWVLTETLKAGTNLGREPELHFWRDMGGNEVDLIAASRGRAVAIEAKSTETATPSLMKGLRYLRDHSDIDAAHILVYAGRQPLSFGEGEAIPWNCIGPVLANRWSRPTSSASR